LIFPNECGGRVSGKVIHVRAIPVQATLGLAAAAFAVTVAAAGPALAASSGWRVDHHPQPAGLSLNGVFTASASQAWVAGTQFSSTSTGATDSKAVIEQWNGSHWTRTTGLPHLTQPTAALNAIGGSGASDVWAVGDTITAAGAEASLAEHFDGSAWTAVPSAEVPGGTLTAVSADSAADAWAGGSTSAGPLVEHWNGTAWQVATMPAPAGARALTSVFVVSADDAWAAGLGRQPGYSGGGFSFLEHWNGSRWSLVSTTAPGTVLTSLAGTGAGDIWALGSTASPAGPLIEHFNGTTWSQVADPAAGGQFLAAIAALTPGDAWAMSANGLLAEHWNGTAWQRTNTAPYLPAGFGLAGMSGVTGGPLFAVGGTGILDQPQP
jgi:hypothetical protein